MRQRSDKEKGMGYYNIGLANEKLGREKVALENYRKSYELHKNQRVLEKITELASNPTSPQ